MTDISTKSLQKGSAEFLVLSILDGPDRHGYELAQIIETRSGGKLSFKAATLYPLLYKLEKQGWVAGRWVEKAGERRRRFYRLTAAGRKVLGARRRVWREFVEALEQVTKIRPRVDSMNWRPLRPRASPAAQGLGRARDRDRRRARDPARVGLRARARPRRLSRRGDGAARSSEVPRLDGTRPQARDRSNRRASTHAGSWNEQWRAHERTRRRCSLRAPHAHATPAFTLVVGGHARRRTRHGRGGVLGDRYAAGQAAAVPIARTTGAGPRHGAARRARHQRDHVSRRERPRAGDPGLRVARRGDALCRARPPHSIHPSASRDTNCRRRSSRHSACSRCSDAPSQPPKGKPGPPTVVILGDGFWQRLGARRDIIGQTLVLDEVPHTVVGVMPADFHVEVFNGRARYIARSRHNTSRPAIAAFRAFRAIAQAATGRVDRTGAEHCRDGRRAAGRRISRHQSRPHIFSAAAAGRHRRSRRDPRSC